MRVGKLIVGALSLTLVPGCGGPTPRETVRLELPDPMECMRDYSPPGEDDPATLVDSLWDATERAEPAAFICSLALREGRGRYGEFEMLYRYYRATGKEPERLNSHLVDLDRETLSYRLMNLHDFSAELTMFETDYFGCRTYDDVATELLMRVDPGEDMSCLPPRWLWRDLWHFWGPRD